MSVCTPQNYGYGCWCKPVDKCGLRQGSEGFRIWQMDTMELLLHLVALCFFAYWCWNWLFHISALIYGKMKLHRKYPNVVLEDLPAISILKPLVDVDPNLYQNLETFFTLRYHKYELLFCIQDGSDGCRSVVQALMNKHPHVDAKILLSGNAFGINPKVNNMATGYDEAKYDMILISDSGIKMQEDTLIDMVVHMTPNVGLVHQIPYISLRKGFASNVEKVFFGSIAKTYIGSDLWRINCIIGWSNLFRKSILDEAGGIKAFRKYLAEDYFMGKEVRRNWRTKCCSHIGQNNTGTFSLLQLNQRICRWKKLRNCVLFVFMFEPLQQCMILGVATCLGVKYLFGISPLFFLPVHFLAWLLLDYCMVTILENDSLPFSKFEYMVCWFLGQCSYILSMAQAYWDPVVTWRGRSFRLKWNGCINEEIPRETEEMVPVDGSNENQYLNKLKNLFLLTVSFKQVYY